MRLKKKKAQQEQMDDVIWNNLANYFELGKLACLGMDSFLGACNAAGRLLAMTHNVHYMYMGSKLMDVVDFFFSK
jgi:hypothetical protein